MSGDSPAVARVRQMAALSREAVSDPAIAEEAEWLGVAEEADALDVVLADLDAARRDVERLRTRTHEIQAQEMAKRAKLDAELAEWHQRYEAARRWTEDVGLSAEWAPDGYHPFWSMTSYNMRSTLLRLVTERDEARRRPRVWLEGDEVPAGVAVVDERGAAEGEFYPAVDKRSLFDRVVVEIEVPDFTAAVATEREHRTRARRQELLEQMAQEAYDTGLDELTSKPENAEGVSGD